MKDRTYIGIIILLAILLCFGLYLIYNSKPRVERVPYEVITYLPSAKTVIHDTITKFKDRKIILEIPNEITVIDSIDIKNKIRIIDSISALLVEKKVDRIETLDTNISLLNDSILDNVKLKISYLTGFKELNVNISERQKRTTIPNIYIPTENKSWFESFVSNYPFATILVSVGCGYAIGSRL